MCPVKRETRHRGVLLPPVDRKNNNEEHQARLITIIKRRAITTMKFQQTVIAMALAAYPATAFSSRPRVSSVIFSRTMGSPSKLVRPTRGLGMILGNLFGGGGGFEQRIDYTALDFPGNELGESATQGKVLAKSLKKPNLEIATFAGGCLYVICSELVLIIRITAAVSVFPK